MIDNRWIVPYSPYLLLKYRCHMSVEGGQSRAVRPRDADARCASSAVMRRGRVSYCLHRRLLLRHFGTHCVTAAAIAGPNLMVVHSLVHVTLAAGTHATRTVRQLHASVQVVRCGGAHTQSGAAVYIHNASRHDIAAAHIHKASMDDMAAAPRLISHAYVR